MDRNTIRLIPLLIMLALATAIASGMFTDKNDRLNDPTLVGYQMVNFRVPTLGTEEKRFAPRDWQGKVIVLNVFASWCKPCAEEHKLWMEFVQKGPVRLYGLAWKDNAANVSTWLNQRGNPYHLIGIDEKGNTTLQLALTGIPETFVLDPYGNIYYHYKGPITREIMEGVIFPLTQKLQKENTHPKKNVN